jgi:hypothetical protein
MLKMRINYEPVSVERPVLDGGLNRFRGRGLVHFRPDEYYPTPAPNADVIRKPLLVGRHLIILNRSSPWVGIKTFS